MNDTVPFLEPIEAPVCVGIGCGYVQPANHWVFHIANTCLFLSYVIPNLLALRILLFAGSTCFVLWGALVLSISVDTVVWNSIFAVINLGQAVWLFYNMRPLKFSPELEYVYQEIFGPTRYNLPRIEFKQLVRGTFIRKLKKNRWYAREQDECTNLAILISGQLEVTRTDPNTKEQIIINWHGPFSFIDSPEWVARKYVGKLEDLAQADLNPIGREYSGDEEQLFDVNIQAKEDSVYLLWPRETLIKTLSKNPSIEGALHAAIGSDLARKVVETGKITVVSRGQVDTAKEYIKSAIGVAPSTSSKSLALIRRPTQNIDLPSGVKASPATSPTDQYSSFEVVPKIVGVEHENKKGQTRAKMDQPASSSDSSDGDDSGDKNAAKLDVIQKKVSNDKMKHNTSAKKHNRKHKSKRKEAVAKEAPTTNDVSSDGDSDSDNASDGEKRGSLSIKSKGKTASHHSERGEEKQLHNDNLTTDTIVYLPESDGVSM